ncbi:hypothetical protein LTR08_008021 [Meristemomyces frigidus]|nr:hypothetical protein LTR08_008021 [Meristemomyces frigidus]
MPQAQPELKKYLDKRVEVQLNGSRKVMGTLRGYDVFLNIVLDEATESKANNEKPGLATEDTVETTGADTEADLDKEHGISKRGEAKNHSRRQSGVEEISLRAREAAKEG